MHTRSGSNDFVDLEVGIFVEIISLPNHFTGHSSKSKSLDSKSVALPTKSTGLSTFYTLKG